MGEPEAEMAKEKGVPMVPGTVRVELVISGAVEVAATVRLTALLATDPEAFVTTTSYVAASLGWTLFSASVAVVADALPVMLAPALRH